MARLRPTEYGILKVLLQSKYYLTTSKIAYRARISWNTAHYYLKQFEIRGWVYRKTVGKVNYWKARTKTY